VRHELQQAVRDLVYNRVDALVGICLVSVLMRADVRLQNSIDPSLITSSLVLEPLKNVWIKTQRDGALPLWESNLSTLEKRFVELWDIRNVDI